MNKTNKICIFIIIAVVVLQIATASYASNKIYNPIIQQEEPKHITYENNEQYTDKMLIYNQQPVYRISADNEGNTNYISNHFGIFGSQDIVNVVKYGYPNFTKEELNCNSEFEAYVATQESIYTIFHGRDINKYEIKDEKGARIYNALKQIVQKAELNTFQEELQLELIEVNNELVEENDTYMSKEYRVELNRPIMLGILNVESGQGIELSKTQIHGEENFKILIPKNKLSQNINVKLTVYVEDFNITIGKNTQMPQYAGQLYLEPRYSNKEYKINAKTSDISTIKITNINKETKTPVQGNKFELLNKELEVVKNELITDIEGQITIENIPKGTYYLKQIEAVEGYCVNKTNMLIEVTGEESIINVKIISDSEKNEKIETLEKEINLNEENINIEEINNKEIINQNNKNTYKDITNNTIEKNYYNNNKFVNTNNIRNIEEIVRENEYNNIIKETCENIGETIYAYYNKTMTKEDFLNFIELITSNPDITRLPEAGI